MTDIKPNNIVANSIDEDAYDVEDAYEAEEASEYGRMDANGSDSSLPDTEALETRSQRKKRLLTLRKFAR